MHVLRFFGWSHGTIHGPTNPEQMQQQCFMGLTVLFIPLKFILLQYFK